MRKLFLTLTILFIFFTGYGQKLNYSLNASVNYPYIANIEETPEAINLSTGYYYTTQGYLSEQYSEKISGKVSGRFSYQISNRLFIGGGLQFNLIRFQQSTYIKGIEDLTFSGEWDFDLIAIEGEPYGSIYGPGYLIDEDGNIIHKDGLPVLVLPTTENNTDLGKTNLLYTEIPIHFGYSFFNNKLNLKLGITLSFLVYAEVYTYNYESFFNKEVIKNPKATITIFP